MTCFKAPRQKKKKKRFWNRFKKIFLFSSLAYFFMSWRLEYNKQMGKKHTISIIIL